MQNNAKTMYVKPQKCYNKIIKDKREGLLC